MQEITNATICDNAIAVNVLVMQWQAVLTERMYVQILNSDH